VYDIVLSDGIHKAKCVLGANLYEALIPSHLLFPFRVLRVTGWKVEDVEMEMENFVIVFCFF
jgi:hypothetical protein